MTKTRAQEFEPKLTKNELPKLKSPDFFAIGSETHLDVVLDGPDFGLDLHGSIPREHGGFNEPPIDGEGE